MRKHGMHFDILQEKHTLPDATSYLHPTYPAATFIFAN